MEQDSSSKTGYQRLVDFLHSYQESPQPIQASQLMDQARKAAMDNAIELSSRKLVYDDSTRPSFIDRDELMKQVGQRMKVDNVFDKESRPPEVEIEFLKLLREKQEQHVDRDILQLELACQVSQKAGTLLASVQDKPSYAGEKTPQQTPQDTTLEIIEQLALANLEPDRFNAVAVPLLLVSGTFEQHAGKLLEQAQATQDTPEADKLVACLKSAIQIWNDEGSVVFLGENDRVFAHLDTNHNLKVTNTFPTDDSFWQKAIPNDGQTHIDYSMAIMKADSLQPQQQ